MIRNIVCLFLVQSLILRIHTDSARLLGCYRDSSKSNKLLKNGYKEFPRTLKMSVCSEYCKARDASYAGLKYGRECHCSKTPPPYTALANDTKCTMKCEGNPNEICGDRELISVYDIDGSGVEKHQSLYVGCFLDSYENRMLPGKLWEFTNSLTPDYCMGQCWQYGYRYAGVQYGTECHCGDEYNSESFVDESECSTPCSGDSELNCGAGLTMNVYSTGITDLSDEDRLIGCFDDQDNANLLSDLQLTLLSTNSAKRCLNICNSLGYKYAGVEFKIECYCGNRKPTSTLLVDDKECSIPCPEDELAACGGNYKLLVFSVTGDPSDGVRRRPAVPLSNTSQGSKKPSNICKKSVTVVNGKNPCRGSVIFHEEFDRPLDRTRWIRSIFMPWFPDFDFVVYTNKDANSFTEDGKLIIKPTLMDEDFIKRGKLTLIDCTGEPFTEECDRKAISYSILPPIESARLTTKESFTFKYGRIDVRAKLPIGDWLYPEIFLVPKRKIYGRDYASGLIRIAGARGNVDLRINDKDIGASYLESGVLLGTPADIKARYVVRRSQSLWNTEYHNFTVFWSPDNMWFMVDNLVKQPLVPEDGANLVQAMSFKNVSNTWNQSSIAMAPFDQEAYIALGLSVGGMRVFPDNCISGDYQKPWSNTETKAMANFLQAKDKWLKTWTEKSSLIQIESVKVTAL